jgi:hypothetical protein
MELRDFFDILWPILAGLGVIITIANIGAIINRDFYDAKFLERCEQKKEFILDRVVVKCEIVKDLR